MTSSRDRGRSTRYEEINIQLHTDAIPSLELKSQHLQHHHTSLLEWHLVNPVRLVTSIAIVTISYSFGYAKPLAQFHPTVVDGRFDHLLRNLSLAATIPGTYIVSASSAFSALSASLTRPFGGLSRTGGTGTYTLRDSSQTVLRGISVHLSLLNPYSLLKSSDGVLISHALVNVIRIHHQLPVRGIV